MKKYILWVLIVVFVIGCSNTTQAQHDNNVTQSKIPRQIKSSSTIVSLSYKKDLSDGSDFSNDEQKKCALINAELALSEKLHKAIDTNMTKSRADNNTNYRIELPCVSREDLPLINNIALLNKENNSSYKVRTWKISGSDILYIWTEKVRK